MDSLSTVVDTLPNIETFKNSVANIELATYFSYKMAQHWQSVAGLTWLLGNIVLGLISIVALLAHRFVNKALKFFTKDTDYKLPKRWIYALYGSIIIGFLAFNILPAALEPDLPNPSGENLEQYP